MKQSKFSKGWDENRVKRVLEHYATLTEDEAVAEDEAVWEDPSHLIHFDGQRFLGPYQQ